MPKTRSQKEQEIKLLEEALRGASSAVLAEFSNVTIAELESFREKAKEKGIKIRVVKNTLLGLALKNLGVQDLSLRKLGKMLMLFMPAKEGGLSTEALAKRDGTSTEALAKRDGTSTEALAKRDGTSTEASAKVDEITIPKLVYEISRRLPEKVKIFAGISEGRRVEAETLMQLAQIPSRGELYAKVVGSLNAPISNFVNLLSGIIRSFVFVIKGISESR